MKAPSTDVVVTDRGAARWQRGHPWIYRSDVHRGGEEIPPGIVRVADRAGRFLGRALCSPRSEIRLRLLERDDRPIDLAWWRMRFAQAHARRDGIDATAYRVVHAEGDGLPGLIVDRYDRWLVVQILSAAIEPSRTAIIDALRVECDPAGILLRNDASMRKREGLPTAVEVAAGEVPERIEVREGPVRYYAPVWTGQKTGAFLDQRPARFRAAHWTRSGGRALDCFSYHGSFALHLARRAADVLALDANAAALARGAENAQLNGLSGIRWREGDAFEVLRALDHEGERFDTVVVDPPAFAKSRDALSGAIRGYREINLRALRLLAPGGVLVTASCSHHVKREAFQALLAEAAADSGRRVTILEHLGQGIDHPECLTVPETGYLKGFILRVE